MGQLQAAGSSSPDAIPPPPQLTPFPSTPKEDKKTTETAKTLQNDNPGDLETLTKRVKGIINLNLNYAQRIIFRATSTAI